MSFLPDSCVGQCVNYTARPPVVIIKYGILSPYFGYSNKLYIVGPTSCPFWSLMSLDAGAKLRKATGSFIVSVSPHGATRFPLKGFSRKSVVEYFMKIC